MTRVAHQTITCDWGWPSGCTAAYGALGAKPGSTAEDAYGWALSVPQPSRFLTSFADYCPEHAERGRRQMREWFAKARREGWLE